MVRIAEKDIGVNLLGIMRGKKPEMPGLKIVTVKTTEPNPITFAFEGNTLALDKDIFEIPVDFYPLRTGDRLLAFPLVGTGASQRWGLIQKINGGLVMGQYANGKILVPNFPKPIVGFLAPANMTLVNGMSVCIAPTLEGDEIRYLIVNVY